MSRITHDICEMLDQSGARRTRVTLPAIGVAEEDRRGPKLSEVPRMQPRGPTANPVSGAVFWCPIKSLWFTGHALVAIVGGCLAFSYEAVLVSFVFTIATLCLGRVKIRDAPQTNPAP